MILAYQSPHDFDPIVFGNVAAKICFRCPYEEDAQFMAKQMGCQPGQIQNLSQNFEAIVRLGSTEMWERIQIVPYFQRIRDKVSPPPSETPPAQPEAKRVEEPTQGEPEFGGQVRLGKKGGLVGDASLKKWTKKDETKN
jgi:hypothetical protein